MRAELRAAWAARMWTFIDRIGPEVVLLWFAGHRPPAEGEDGEGPLGADPLFVTARMVEGLRPLVRGIVIVPPAPMGEGPEEAQERAAAALAGPLRALLAPGEVRASR